ncbi:MAG: glycoside hydrolase [Lentisphaeria bacterium]|jgi:hypothetical protein
MAKHGWRRCLCDIALLTLLATAGNASAAGDDGAYYHFENDNLRVSVHRDQPVWDVLDKRSGRLWRQATAKSHEVWQVPIARRSATVQLDADLAEWRDAGMAVNNGRDGAPGSGRFHVVWDDEGLWFAADVVDEKVTGLVDGVPQWHVDGIELWIGREQWGLIPNGDELVISCWTNPAMAAGCRGAAKIGGRGWQMELLVPWSQIKAFTAKAAAGRQFLLAFGINNAEGGPKRQSQYFFPPGYKHKQFMTHAMAKLTDETVVAAPFLAELRVGSPQLRGISPLPKPAQGVEIALDYPQEGGDSIALTAKLWLLPGAGDLAFELSGDADMSFKEIAYPAPIILEELTGRLVIPQMAGLLFGVDELEWNGKAIGGNISMPWYGQTDLARGDGVITIIQTADDCCGRGLFRGVKVAGASGDRLSVQPVWEPQKGRFGYTRRLLFHFAHEGSYTALAKRYRAYAKETGLLKTLVEKRRERPNIDRLVGAVNIYGNHWANIEELHRRGVERAMVSGLYDKAQQMRDWGYLPGRYDIYTDLYDPQIPPGKWERCEGFAFPDDVVKKADGTNQIGWCPWTDPKTGEKHPSYVICWTRGLEVLKEKMPKRLAQTPYGSYFLDCVTSTALYECYDPRHPLTRTQDREARVAQMGYLSNELGLIVGSESGRDWGAHVADYFEGIMSSASFFANFKAIHAMPFVSCEPTERYLEYGINPARRVPLYQLVYGDCMETTWRWGDNTHRMPGIWWQKELLEMLHAGMPTFVLWDVQQELFWGNVDRFVDTYNRVCRWRRAVGYSEMLRHERLSDDGLLQRSSFANGAAITVNFAPESRVVDGVTMPRYSYLLTGDLKILAGLPVGVPMQQDDSWSPKPFVMPAGTDFESKPLRWRAAADSVLTPQGDIVHGGAVAAKLVGKEVAGWTYALGPSVPLKSGKSYLMRGWVRVDAVEPAEAAPSFKCGLYRDGKWFHNEYGSRYDLSKMGTWQLLEGRFTVPEGNITGHLALEKRLRAPVSITLYFDDVELIELDDVAKD